MKCLKIDTDADRQGTDSAPCSLHQCGRKRCKMYRVHYLVKGVEFDFKRVDHKMYIDARDYFIDGGLYYFRLNEFNYLTLAKEDIISIERW